jgi:hypothetical protein
MELILLVAGVCLLGVLAARFGADSRPPHRSAEDRLAGFGFTWQGRPGTRARARLRTATYPLRHQLAAVLYRLADWLYPVSAQGNRSSATVENG